MQLFTRAVEDGGDVNAMVLLGVVLRKGAEGVQPNPVRAMHLFINAIEQGGSVGARIHLGLLLESGAEAVVPNPVRSVELWTRAIEEGGGADRHWKNIIAINTTQSSNALLILLLFTLSNIHFNTMKQVNT